MEDSPNHGRNRCVDCGALSPPTETNYTLISPRHGWRLSRTVDEHGRRFAQWRCKDCWERHKSLFTPTIKK
jgi:hypothetical protein